ncbi:TnsD family Tn7-like transposition protein [Comamonas guangdongensis]|uniref:TnsD family Tn7-like transposition protein n=1 Tax=Comamonas guangdongensis TaxID=510515 RepID=A0ABV4A0E8_9BURK
MLKNHDVRGEEHLLADAALALWKLPISFTFVQDRLNRLYKAKLVEQGFVHAASSRVDHKRFEQALASVLTASLMTVSWPWLDSRIFSRRLLRMGHSTSPRVSRHPLNHLPLIILLFGSWESFWAAYHELDNASLDCDAIDFPRQVLIGQEAPDPKELLRASLIEKIHSGQSVSRAAELTGVAVATAMAWAASEGIQSPRRPKLLKPDVRSRLVLQLKRGVDKAVAASLVSISVATVTRVLLTEPGLHAQWSAARFIKAQKRSRKSWQTIRDAFPAASSNEWRRLDPAAYAWLYRNDRLWLQNSIQARSFPPTTSTQRRDWHQRDASLAQAVRVAALDWYMSNSGTHLTIGILCAAVKGLRQKMSALPKLPLTRKAIQEACADHRSAASTSQREFSTSESSF